MYRWELDGPAQQHFADLNPAVQASLAAFMDAVVIVDPVQYQRRRDEPDDVSRPLRTLHFGLHDEGLVTFEPTATGTRMRWSGQVRPKGGFRLLGPLITWMGIRQKQRI